MMKKTLLIIALFAVNVAYAQHFNAGIRIQKTQGMYWENGITAQYSFANFASNKFYVGFDYVTSRLGSALGSNAIKQDNFMLSGTWFFNDTRAFRFGVRGNVGYFYSNLEEDIFSDIPNTSLLLSPEILFKYTSVDIPVSANLGMGYNINTLPEGQSPGTLQPLFFHLDLYYTIFKPSSDE